MNTGVIAGLFTGIQIGAVIFASQFLVGEMGVGLFGLLRYAIALLVLIPLFLIKPRTSIDRDDWIIIALLGIGQVAVMAILLNTAVLYTSGARVALVFATLPAVSFIIDKLRNNTPANWCISVGITLTISSVVMLVGYDVITDAFSVSDMIGVIAAFAATVVVAICSSWYKPYVKRYGKIQISVIAFGVSLIPLAFFAYLFPSSTPVSSWPSSAWWLLVSIGLSSGLGYLLWFHAVSTLSATTVTGFLALSPITAAVLALVFSSSAFTPSLIASVFLVSLGIGFFAYSNSKQQTLIFQR
ncbi:MAG: DMT family transporter [Oceanospirillaceae bacterium]